MGYSELSESFAILGSLSGYIIFPAHCACVVLTAVWAGLKICTKDMEDGQRHRRSSNGGYNRERGPAERDRGRYNRNGRGRPRERERERPRGGRGKVLRLDQKTCLFHWYMNFL